MRRHSWLFLIFVAVLIHPTYRSVQTAGPVYTIEDLGTIDGVAPVPTGINAAGQVSGFVNDASGYPHAVRYTDGIGWQYIPSYKPGLEGYSVAMGINAYGDIVGYRFTSSYQMRAFRYTDAGGLQEIGPLDGGSSSYGMAINDSGTVVGYGDAFGAYRGWRASPGLPPVALAQLSGAYETACGINAAGQIAATAMTAAGYMHAIRIDSDGNGITDAGSFDGANGMSQSGCAIDDDGSFGGAASVAGSFRAFVYRDSQLADVTQPLGTPYSMVQSMAAGTQVGWFMSPIDFGVRAFMHNDTDGAVDLNSRIPADSLWMLQQATGINANGQIVGTGTLNDTPRAFRLRTAPPPDRTPPTITSLSVTPSSIVPPNNAMVPVVVSVVASDDRDPSPACALTGIGSANAADADALVTGPYSASVRAVGGRTYSLRVTCSDAAGNTTPGSVDVVVPPDTTAPVISRVSVTPTEIWSLTKQMVPVSVTVTATDDSEATPSCGISGITSNEGSSSDYAITGSLSAQVRAWRMGTGTGRVYTIAVSCSDAAGNTATSSVKVTVAHDMGK